MSAKPPVTLPGFRPTPPRVVASAEPSVAPDGLRARGYRLIERLGAGGMGEVWRARHERLDREVAIKRMTLHHAESSDRLVQEARALARLRHPAIVGVFDVVEDDHGVPYLVMELVDGADLARVVDEGGPLAEPRAVRLVLGVLSGLEAAHRHGIVHGDVKPANILLARDDTGVERAVLLDFGLAAAIDPRPDHTRVLAGTPEYMAPEQLSERTGGPLADQWAACVTLYMLVSGRAPFARPSLPELFDAIRTAPLPYPRDRAMDPRLFAILARGTRKQPGERYPDMRELHAALAAWLRAVTPGRSP